MRRILFWPRRHSTIATPCQPNSSGRRRERSTNSGSQAAARHNGLAPPVRGHSCSRSWTTCQAIRPFSYKTSTPKPYPWHPILLTHRGKGEPCREGLFALGRIAHDRRRQGSQPAADFDFAANKLEHPRKTVGWGAGWPCASRQARGTGSPIRRAASSVCPLSNAVSIAASDGNTALRHSG